MNTTDTSTQSENSNATEYVYKVGDFTLRQPVKLKHFMALVFGYAAWVFLSSRVALLFNDGRTGFFVAVFFAIGLPFIAATGYRVYLDRRDARK